MLYKYIASSNKNFQDKARKALGVQIDAMEDGYTDFELFSLSDIKVWIYFSHLPGYWNSWLVNDHCLHQIGIV